ncbi:hypothetical protein KI387_042093, partial [Taxus chinensis]
RDRELDEAMQVDARKKWEKAMDRSIALMERTNIGDWVKLLRKKSITEQWVFRVKAEEGGKKDTGPVGGQGVCIEK